MWVSTRLDLIGALARSCELEPAGARAGRSSSRQELELATRRELDPAISRAGCQTTSPVREDGLTGRQATSLPEDQPRARGRVDGSLRGAKRRAANRSICTHEYSIQRILYG